MDSYKDSSAVPVWWQATASALVPVSMSGTA
ncbi:hypothetical protein J3E61_005722 [Mycobacterium sp. OAE908]